MKKEKEKKKKNKKLTQKKRKETKLCTIDADKPRSSISNFYYNAFVGLCRQQ